MMPNAGTSLRDSVPNTFGNSPSFAAASGISAQIIVELTVRIGYAVFTVATLSFLGVGPPRPSPDWGAQVAENYGVLSAGIWWPTIFPALAIASLVVAVNLMADAVQSVWEG